jgi:NAD(P)-dependent dehydrogenase (short-subunit alcohol dehydrogenase family)
MTTTDKIAITANTASTTRTTDTSRAANTVNNTANTTNTSTANATTAKTAKTANDWISAKNEMPVKNKTLAGNEPPVKAEALKGEFKGKVVVVSGGSQGIGRCVAGEFAKAGAIIILISRTKSDIDTAANELRAAGGRSEGFAADVSVAAQVEEAISQVVRKYGRVDVLVNCAGIYGPIGPFLSNDLAEWQKAIDINLIGTVNCAHAVIPFMLKEKAGKIINFCGGGVGSAHLKPNFSAYLTSKFAIAGFTEAIATELKEFNIQVNAISPGAVNTRLLDQVLKAGELAGSEFMKKSERQKLEGGTPPELAARLALFLASRQSDFVTGKLISAVWDKYEQFGKMPDEFSATSLYTLRRIDNFGFREV